MRSSGDSEVFFLELESLPGFSATLAGLAAGAPPAAADLAAGFTGADFLADLSAEAAAGVDAPLFGAPLASK